MRTLFQKVYTENNQELWIKITDNIISNVSPIYWISNYGRIYSDYSKSIRVLSLDHNGYPVVCLRLRNGQAKLCKVHRLVAMAFIEESRDKTNLFVNHKDGNKTNNHMSNLEWVTPKENTRHAIETGLMIFGENIHTAKFTNEIVIKIAEMLLENESYDNIISQLNLTNDDDTRRRIKRIRSKESWCWLLQDYDFSNYDAIRNSRLFSIDELHKICLFLQEHGKESSTIDIMKHLGYDFYSFTPEKRKKFIHTIACIKNRSKYTKYSKYYNF